MAKGLEDIGLAETKVLILGVSLMTGSDDFVLGEWGC